MTLVQLAKEAGVSIVTASRVMNGHPRVREELRDRVLKCAEQHNYTPNIYARNLVKSSSKLIGLYISQLSNPYFGSVSEKLSKSFREIGYELLLSNDKDEHFRLSNSFSTAGSVMVSTADEEALKKIVSIGKPVIGLNIYCPKDLKIPNLLYDFDRSYLAFSKVLLASGKKSVSFVSKVDLKYQRRKFHTCKNFIKSNGGEIIAPERSESFSTVDEFIAYIKTSDDKRPDAVFCENDLLAMEIQSVLFSLGVHDIKIIGCDGIIPFKSIWTVKLDIDFAVRTIVNLFKVLADGGMINEKIPEIPTTAVFN